MTHVVNKAYIDVATQNYLNAALFAESCNGMVPGCDIGEDCDRSLADHGLTIDNIDEKSAADARADVKRFLLIVLEIAERYPADEFGYDFWMTRTSEGVGFWDGDYEANPGDGKTLTDVIHEHFPHVDAYVGDNGSVYIA